MTPEEVAVEFMSDLRTQIPDINKKIILLSSGKLSNQQEEIKKIETEMHILAQNTGLLAYNLHLAMTASEGNQLPISEYSDLQYEEKVKELSQWLVKNHPELNNSRL